MEKRTGDSKVVKMSDYVYDRSWKEVFRGDGPRSGVAIYVNKQTGEFDVVSTNDEGEAISTTLSTVDSGSLIVAVAKAHSDIMKKT